MTGGGGEVVGSVVEGGGVEDVEVDFVEPGPVDVEDVAEAGGRDGGVGQAEEGAEEDCVGHFEVVDDVA